MLFFFLFHSEWIVPFSMRTPRRGSSMRSWEVTDVAIHPSLWIDKKMHISLAQIWYKTIGHWLYVLISQWNVVSKILSHFYVHHPLMFYPHLCFIYSWWRFWPSFHNSPRFRRWSKRNLHFYNSFISLIREWSIIVLSTSVFYLFLMTFFTRFSQVSYVS